MWTAVKKIQLVKNLWKLKPWFFLPQKKVSFQPIEMAYTVHKNNAANQSANPLIVMHGMLESKDYWHNTSQILMQELHRRVYAVDLRNHGDSPHTVEYNDQEIAEDLLKFIMDQKLTKVNIFGQGIGGRAMMFFALKYPQLVERGVILDLLPRSVPRGLKEMVEVLLAMKFSRIATCESKDECQAALMQNMKDGLNRPELVCLLMENIRKGENGGYFWATNIDGLLQHISHISSFMMYIKPMDPFTNPMMFLCCNDSSFINSQTWPVIKILFPNSEIHWLNINDVAYICQSEQFFQLVFEFLCK